MRASSLPDPMSLPALPLAPGTGRGTVLFVEGPETWSVPEQDAVVLAVREGWWPRLEIVSQGVRACVTDGSGLASRPSLGVAAVGGIDRDLLRPGEVVEVDGTAGRLNIEGVSEQPVVTALLERADGKILLLRRSDRVGSFRGRWAGVSGFLETPEPLDQALTEVREETGLPPTALRLVRSGRCVLARDGARVYVVHPFLFRVERAEVRLDWEHTDAEWVDPEEITRRQTVPKLDRVWKALAGPADARKS